MICGGGGRHEEDRSTEIYDFMKNEFVAGPDTLDIRDHHTATLLSDGRVLICGGDYSNTTEIYDPKTKTFTYGPAFPW